MTVVSIEGSGYNPLHAGDWIAKLLPQAHVYVAWVWEQPVHCCFEPFISVSQLMDSVPYNMAQWPALVSSPCTRPAEFKPVLSTIIRPPCRKLVLNIWNKWYMNCLNLLTWSLEQPDWVLDFWAIFLKKVLKTAEWEFYQNLMIHENLLWYLYHTLSQSGKIQRYHDS